VNWPFFTQPLRNGNDFPRGSMTSLIGCSRDVTEHHFARHPSTGCAWFAAGTVKNVFLAATLNRGNHAGAIFIRSKRDDVSRMALRAFNAMSSARHEHSSKAGIATVLYREASHSKWSGAIPT
jgi:hypothetical protein